MASIRVRTSLVVLAALTATTAACSGAVEAATPAPSPNVTATPVTSPTPTPTPTRPPSPTRKQRSQPAQLPLTGREVDQAPDAPVVAIKVDNTEAAFPQSGLSQADMLVEEPVEGGVTRLVVMVHSQAGTASEAIGPVRSVRDSDIGIVSPVDAVLFASGGAPVARAGIASAGIETRFDEAPGFVRRAGRDSVHNRFLYVRTALAALAASEPPSPYFDWAGPNPKRLPNSSPLESFQLVFSPHQTTTMQPSKDGWIRALDEPDGFEATTVIALTVDQVLAPYVDPGGWDVPIAVTEGTGTGWIAHNGRVTEIVWSKSTPRDRWTFTTPGGRPVKVPQGTTYLALLPSSSGSLVPIG